MDLLSAMVVVIVQKSESKVKEFRVMEMEGISGEG